MTSLAARLDAYLMESARPFDWATHNCCHFAGRWVQIVEGRDPLADLPMVSMKAMARAVQEFGCLESAICFQLGRAPVAPAMAQLGDIVLMPTRVWGGDEGRFSVGICCGSRAVFITETGAWCYWPVLEAACAWRVQPT